MRGQMQCICPRFVYIAPSLPAFLHKKHLFFFHVLSPPSKTFVQNCVFCTGRQVSMCHFTQFYISGKEIIEIYKVIMYNGNIRVS